MTVVCLLVLGCGRTLTVYYRTSPRRVEVSKQVSPRSLLAVAVQAAPGAVDVHLKFANLVTLRRSLYYNSSAIIYDHSRSIANEAFEMIAGILLTLSPVLFWGIESRLDGQDTPDRKVVRRRGWLLALFDPATSAFANNARVEPVVKEQVFRDPPLVREYEIRVPASNTAVEFRILDEANRELAQGSATTDLYGELHVQGAFKHAVAVELSRNGAVIVVPIQSSGTPSAPPPEPAAMPRVRTSAALVNDGWARQSKENSFLPRVALTLDLAQLPSPDLAIIGEVRLDREFSVGWLVGRESFSGLPFNVRKRQIDEIGGYLRWYVTGHVGTGIHLGFEAVGGFSDIAPRPDTLELDSYGLTFGYKYTFSRGFTFDLATSLRYLMLDDPTASQQHVWEWKPLGHISFGWSF